MATSKLQVYTSGLHAARRDVSRLGSARRYSDTSLHGAPVYAYVYILVNESITARFTRCYAPYVRACVRFSGMSTGEYMRFGYDSRDAICVLAHLRRGHEKNHRLVSLSRSLLFFSLPFLGTYYTRARIKGPLIEFFSKPAQTRVQRRVRVYFSHVFLIFAYLTPSYELIYTTYHYYSIEVIFPS